MSLNRTCSVIIGRLKSPNRTTASLSINRWFSNNKHNAVLRSRCIKQIIGTSSLYSKPYSIRWISNFRDFRFEKYNLIPLGEIYQPKLFQKYGLKEKIRGHHDKARRSRKILTKDKGNEQNKEKLAPGDQFQPIASVSTKPNLRGMNDMNPVISKLKDLFYTIGVQSLKKASKPPKKPPLSIKLKKYSSQPKLSIEHDKIHNFKTESKRLGHPNEVQKSLRTKENIDLERFPTRKGTRPVLKRKVNSEMSLLLPRPIYECKTRKSVKPVKKKKPKPLLRDTILKIFRPLPTRKAEPPEKAVKHAEAVVRLLNTTNRMERKGQEEKMKMAIPRLAPRKLIRRKGAPSPNSDEMGPKKKDSDKDGKLQGVKQTRGRKLTPVPNRPDIPVGPRGPLRTTYHNIFEEKVKEGKKNKKETPEKISKNKNLFTNQTIESLLPPRGKPKNDEFFNLEVNEREVFALPLQEAVLKQRKATTIVNRSTDDGTDTVLSKPSVGKNNKEIKKVAPADSNLARGKKKEEEEAERLLLLKQKIEEIAANKVMFDGLGNKGEDGGVAATEPGPQRVRTLPPILDRPDMKLKPSTYIPPPPERPAEISSLLKMVEKREMEPWRPNPIKSTEPTPSSTDNYQLLKVEEPGKALSSDKGTKTEESHLKLSPPPFEKRVTHNKTKDGNDFKAKVPTLNRSVSPPLETAKKNQKSKVDSVKEASTADSSIGSKEISKFSSREVKRSSSELLEETNKNIFKLKLMNKIKAIRMSGRDLPESVGKASISPKISQFKKSVRALSNSDLSKALEKENYLGTTYSKKTQIKKINGAGLPGILPPSEDKLMREQSLTLTKGSEKSLSTSTSSFIRDSSLSKETQRGICDFNKYKAPATELVLSNHNVFSVNASSPQHLLDINEEILLKNEGEKNGIRTDQVQASSLDYSEAKVVHLARPLDRPDDSKNLRDDFMNILKYPNLSQCRRKYETNFISSCTPKIVKGMVTMEDFKASAKGKTAKKPKTAGGRNFVLSLSNTAFDKPKAGIETERNFVLSLSNTAFDRTKLHFKTDRDRVSFVANLKLREKVKEHEKNIRIPKIFSFGMKSQSEKMSALKPARAVLKRVPNRADEVKTAPRPPPLRLKPLPDRPETPLRRTPLLLARPLDRPDQLRDPRADHRNTSTDRNSTLSSRENEANNIGDYSLKFERDKNINVLGSSKILSETNAENSLLIDLPRPCLGSKNLLASVASNLKIGGTNGSSEAPKRDVLPSQEALESPLVYDKTLVQNIGHNLKESLPELRTLDDRVPFPSEVSNLIEEQKKVNFSYFDFKNATHEVAPPVVRSDCRITKNNLESEDYSTKITENESFNRFTKPGLSLIRVAKQLKSLIPKEFLLNATLFGSPPEVLPGKAKRDRVRNLKSLYRTITRSSVTKKIRHVPPPSFGFSIDSKKPVLRKKSASIPGNEQKKCVTSSNKPKEESKLSAITGHHLKKPFGYTGPETDFLVISPSKSPQTKSVEVKNDEFQPLPFIAINYEDHTPLKSKSIENFTKSKQNPKTEALSKGSKSKHSSNMKTSPAFNRGDVFSILPNSLVKSTSDKTSDNSIQSLQSYLLSHLNPFAKVNREPSREPRSLNPLLTIHSSKNEADQMHTKEASANTAESSLQIPTERNEIRNMSVQLEGKAEEKSRLKSKTPKKVSIFLTRDSIRKLRKLPLKNRPKRPRTLMKEIEKIVRHNNFPSEKSNLLGKEGQRESKMRECDFPTVPSEVTIMKVNNELNSKNNLDRKRDLKKTFEGKRKEPLSSSREMDVRYSSSGKVSVSKTIEVSDNNHEKALPKSVFQLLQKGGSEKPAPGEVTQTKSRSQEENVNPEIEAKREGENEVGVRSPVPNDGQNSSKNVSFPDQLKINTNFGPSPKGKPNNPAASEYNQSMEKKCNKKIVISDDKKSGQVLESFQTSPPSPTPTSITQNEPKPEEKDEKIENPTSNTPNPTLHLNEDKKITLSGHTLVESEKKQKDHFGVVKRISDTVSKFVQKAENILEKTELSEKEKVSGSEMEEAPAAGEKHSQHPSQLLCPETLSNEIKESNISKSDVIQTETIPQNQCKESNISKSDVIQTETVPQNQCKAPTTKQNIQSLKQKHLKQNSIKNASVFPKVNKIPISKTSAAVARSNSICADYLRQNNLRINVTSGPYVNSNGNPEGSWYYGNFPKAKHFSPVKNEYAKRSSFSEGLSHPVSETRNKKQRATVEGNDSKGEQLRSSSPSRTDSASCATVFKESRMRSVSNSKVIKPMEESPRTPSPSRIDLSLPRLVDSRSKMSSGSEKGNTLKQERKTSPSRIDSIRGFGRGWSSKTAAHMKEKRRVPSPSRIEEISHEGDPGGKPTNRPSKLCALYGDEPRAESSSKRSKSRSRERARNPSKSFSERLRKGLKHSNVKFNPEI